MTVLCATNTIFQKDKDAILDYKFDWKAKTNGFGAVDWLQDGESIASFTLTSSPSGLTVSNAALTDDNTSITFWLTGGAVGAVYSIVCNIITDSLPLNRVADRTMVIEIVEK